MCFNPSEQIPAIGTELTNLLDKDDKNGIPNPFLMILAVPKDFV
jgi:hypothetical protein